MGFDLKAYQKEYKEKHKEEAQEYRKAYRLANPEKVSEGKKKCYRAKRQQYLSHNKQYQKDNYPEVYARIKEWNSKNQLKVKGYKYKTRHNPARKEQILAYNREYENRPEVKIRKRLRCRLGCLLRKIGRYKEESILEYIGCTIDFLRDYLSKNAPEGFSWDDKVDGRWHIDHIIPCNAFHLKCKYHQRLCFHYSNLRILKAEDNLKKGKKYEFA